MATLNTYRNLRSQFVPALQAYRFARACNYNWHLLNGESEHAFVPRFPDDCQAPPVFPTPEKTKEQVCDAIHSDISFVDSERLVHQKTRCSKLRELLESQKIRGTRGARKVIVKNDDDDCSFWTVSDTVPAIESSPLPNYRQDTCDTLTILVVGNAQPITVNVVGVYEYEYTQDIGDSWHGVPIGIVDKERSKWHWINRERHSVWELTEEKLEACKQRESDFRAFLLSKGELISKGIFVPMFRREDGIAIRQFCLAIHTRESANGLVPVGTLKRYVGRYFQRIVAAIGYRPSPSWWQEFADLCIQQVSVDYALACDSANYPTFNVMNSSCKRTMFAFAFEKNVPKSRLNAIDSAKRVKKNKTSTELTFEDIENPQEIRARYRPQHFLGLHDLDSEQISENAKHIRNSIMHEHPRNLSELSRISGMTRHHAKIALRELSRADYLDGVPIPNVRTNKK